MKIFFYHSIVLLTSTLLLVLYANTISNDFYQYELIYDQFADFEGSLKEAIIFHRFEPGFALLYYYFPSFLSAKEAFFVLAIPSMMLKYLFFHKYLRYASAAWFFYVLIFLPNLDSSALRTAIVSTIIIYVLLSSTSNYGYIFKAIAALMFHYIGIVILLIRLYKHVFFALLIFGIATFFFNDLLRLFSGEYLKLSYYSNGGDGAVNYFSTNAAAHLLLSLYCFIGWKGFNDAQKKGGFLILIGLLFYYLLSYNPSIAHRLREVSLLGIFPMLFLTRVKFSYASLLAFTAILYITLYQSFLTIVELNDYI